MSFERKILFVCMGNICRSPTAEGIFRKLSGEHPELQNLEIDSCGTIDYHIGEPSDPRSISAARQRGYDLSMIRARQISSEDLDYYDHIFAMDSENLSNINKLAKEEVKYRTKIKLFLDYAKKNSTRNVPDPYYGGATGFDHVIDLIEEASHGFISFLLEQISKNENHQSRK